MELGSKRNIRSISLDYSKDCTRGTSTLELVSVWPFVNASWNVTTEESGSNPPLAAGQPSTSRSPSDKAQQRRAILIVEDSRADVYLIRESIEIAGIDADVHIVQDGEKAIRFFESVDADDTAPCPALVIL